MFTGNYHFFIHARISELARTRAHFKWQNYQIIIIIIIIIKSNIFLIIIIIRIINIISNKK